MKGGSISSSSSRDTSSLVLQELTGKQYYHLLPTEPKAHDANLEKWIVNCANEITSKKPTFTEKDIARALVSLKLAINPYITHIETQFADAHNLKSVSRKKDKIVEILNNLAVDNRRIFDLLACLRHYDLCQFSFELLPLTQMLHKHLKKLIQRNIYEQGFYDALRVEIAELHIELGLDEGALKNSKSARVYFEGAIELYKCLSEINKKNSRNKANLSIAFDQLTQLDLTDGYLALACNTLKKTKKEGSSDGYLRNCITASEAFANQNDFANAFIWLKEGMPFYQSNHFILLLDMKGITLSEADHKQFLANKTNLLQTYLKIHYSSIISLLTKNHHETNRNFGLNFDASQLEIDTVTPISWSDYLKNKLLKLCDKKYIKFTELQVVINPISHISIEALSKIFSCVHQIEIIQIERNRNEAENKRKIEELNQKIIDLNIQSNETPVTVVEGNVIKIESESSKIKVVDEPLVQFEAVELVVDTRTKLEKKLDKTRTRLEEQKIEVELLVESDAKILGFDEAIFGKNAFHQCRMRTLGKRPIYVVYDSNKCDSQPPEEIVTEYTTLRFPNAKIVAPEGEPGFKWDFRKEKQPNGQSNPPILYCKSKGVGKGWRLYPTDVQVQKDGKMAFLYGEFHETKNGLWDKNVRIHGLPKLKKHS